jgi:(2R)-sulfolactate sulfo-lyase subunit alpha
MDTDETIHVTALDDIPIGHKVALGDIANGDTIMKYGHDIGKAVADIKKGGHLHVHNVKTKRW